ncbi:hypothetical protein KL921_001783 [Ogataea angusta]|nr:hypothetical protein KL921_001783 [Ogataea angusta]KAG7830583.1 hypothetical protein KL920_002221 [Ogataea angusta]KAG7834285.1 hypothetical protein KL943_002669 [Ogataea angusta]KAG7861629.1 hypothetical protein KL939_000650 [Ogataea angusta]
MTTNLDSKQLEQLKEAEKLAFEHQNFFEQILDTTISICLGTPCNEFRLQYQCLSFIHKAFYEKKIDSFELRSQQSVKVIQLLDYLIIRNEERSPNYLIIQKCIDILNATYDLIFLQMVQNPNEDDWERLSNVKDYLLSQWPSSYPLQPYNPETDLSRSIACKTSLIKLIGRIIQVQLPASPSITDIEHDISVSMIKTSHPFLLNSNLSSQAQNLLDNLFTVLNDDVLLPTGLFTTIMSTMMTLFKARPKFLSNKFIMFILAYESQLKIEPRFEREEKLKMKLTKRFNDRVDKCLISILLNKGFLAKDPGLRTRFENKFNYLVDKARDQRQKGILNVDDDDDLEVKEIKRQKVEAIQRNNMLFYNESRIARSHDYKSIYNLIKPNDQLTEFDMSTIPTDVLVSMVITALQKISVAKLVKGLTIVSDRYKDITTNTDSAFQGIYVPSTNEGSLKRKRTDDDEFGIRTRMKTDTGNDISNEIDDAYNDDELKGDFLVPVPKEFSFNSKKEQLALIVRNFIKQSAPKIKQNNSTSDQSIQHNALDKLAISIWNEESWVKVLSRLATRGLANDELSDCMRKSVFNYFKDDMRNRIDGVIEWLNEEYYSEIRDTTGVQPQKDGHYMTYCAFTLDNLIPFLDSSDRKVFIRLMSELPYLDKSLISKLRSLCKDPVRSKLGFQSLLYLIMFRPPVLPDCLGLLTDMLNDASSDDALKKECSTYLKKYSPQ